MIFIEASKIISIFKALNDSGLEYVLMRNINDELPACLKAGKDIDLLIRKKDYGSFKSFFREHGYKRIRHPSSKDTFLYGVDRFEFQYQRASGIIFDLNFQLAVRSLDDGQWIPLHQSVQEAAWENRRLHRSNEQFSYWTLGHADEFVTLVARAVFDKRRFEHGYVQRLKTLLSKVDKSDVEQKLKKVFFAYTPYLLRSMEKGDFENIINGHLSF
ncbi:MAG TPA: nucleotidyltransferase family protein, partial [Candidatus Omnitrophota bacterium]|nr:nucleotidyltransferase family protein [Candidatus Omnitrophota bacterium]